MQTYFDKLQELGVEALEENKDAIKKAIAESQIEIIKKAPQMLKDVLDMVLSSDDSDEE